MATKLPSPFAVLKKLLDREEELGEFIAGPDATGIRGHVQEGYRHRCRELSNVPGWARGLGGAAFGSASRICKPYWDENGWSAPTNEPAWQGGQCPVNYNATWEQRRFNSQTQQFFWAQESRIGTTMVGPMQITSPTNNIGCPTGTFDSREQVVPSQGAPFNIGFGGCSDVSPGYRNLVFTRQDGSSDEGCDPPPERQPGPTPAPDPGPLPGPEPVDDPNFPEGPPLLPIPPFDDPLGGPTPIEAPEDDPLSFDPIAIPGNPDTSPGGGDDVAEPFNVDPGPGGGGVESDFGDPPSGRSWVGCLLRFTFPSSIGAIAGSGPANPVSPRVVGNASLVFENGRGDAFQIRSASMVLARPTGALRVTGVYVNSDPGITYTVRPLSLKNCPDNECARE